MIAKKQRRLSFLFLLLAALLTACGDVFSKTATSPSATVTPTIEITSTPTLPPPGSEDNPLRLGFVVESGTNRSNDLSRQETGQQLSELTGLSIHVQQYADPRDMLKALEDGKVDIVWLQPLTYIYAREQQLVRLGLLTNHFGTYYYGAQFIANVESGFISYFDPTVNVSTANAQTALAQLDGRRPCWVEPGSISGYVLPVGILEQLAIEVQSGVLAQTHTAVVRSLYIKGICDFGVTFSIFGDPRTSSQITTDLPDAPARVVILWQTNPDIPNLNLSYSIAVSEAHIKQINAALMDIVNTSEGKRLLTQALDDYDVQDFQVVDDSVYDPLRAAIRWSGTDVSQWIGR